MLREDLAPSVIVIMVGASGLITTCGGRTSGLPDRPDESTPGIACGPTACNVPSETCLACPDGPGCKVQPDIGSRPDWWTNGQLCTPRLPMLADVPQFDCDDDDDCSAGGNCAAATGRERTFCLTTASATWWDNCVGEWGYVCRDLADCPPCATACAPFEALPTLKRCVTSQ
jgi:hypothetical protein